MSTEKPAKVLALPERVSIEARVIEGLHTCYDPEIPINIYDLGLIYGVDISEHGDVHVRMTLTSPFCPAAQTLPVDVEDKARQVPGVRNVKVDIVWDPPWSMDRISDAAKLQLGLT